MAVIISLFAARESRVGRQTRKQNGLTAMDTETLLYIASDLTGKAIAEGVGVQTKSIQSRVKRLNNVLLHGEIDFAKETAGVAIYNPRMLIVCEALRRGIIILSDICEIKSQNDRWLEEKFNYRPIQQC
jgi:hypothetical protein